ncbi:MAG: ComEC/Rec2 family competence protein, partial [Polyangiales bacterium]
MLPWIASAWLTGLFAGAQWQPTGGPLLLSVALLGTLPIALYARELRARLWVAPLAGLAFLAGLSVIQASAAPCRVSREILGVAKVESVRYRQSDALLRLRLLGARALDKGAVAPEGELVGGRIDIDHAPPVGSVVAFKAELRPRTTLHNPSPHPSLSPRPRTCWARWVSEPPLEVEEISTWRAEIHRARAKVRRHLSSNLPEDAAAVARALVLGDGAALGYERRQAIASVGLAHLFAVSGLHIALVSGTLVGILRWLFAGFAIGFD